MDRSAGARHPRQLRPPTGRRAARKHPLRRASLASAQVAKEPRPKAVRRREGVPAGGVAEAAE
ncbi:MAG: hypothetical protein QOH26_22, partial [Actinomycetota bacterium]|nr:hypothetical protein [Actinomycetota bacterium]